MAAAKCRWPHCTREATRKDGFCSARCKKRVWYGDQKRLQRDREARAKTNDAGWF